MFARKARKCKATKCLSLLVFVVGLSIVILLWGEQLLLPSINSVNRNYVVTIPPRFVIKPPFSFPQPDGIRSVEELSNSNWIHRLANILAKKQHRIIYLLACDYNAYPSLLNWFVSAYVNTEIDLEDILVVSFDEKTYRILNERDISTIYINSEEFIRYHYLLSWKIEPFTFHSIIRMSVARLLSHWNFDVVVFDVDAIPLKDPESLFKLFSDSDIISAHSPPEDISCGTWSLSFGFAFFRSNRMVEYLWEYSSNISENRWHDQGKLNCAINLHFGSQWSLEEKRTQKCKTTRLSNLCDVTGVTKTGLKITLLSRWTVCRFCGLSKMEDYYIWHKQGDTRSQADREMAADIGSVWFLKDNWKNIDKKSTKIRENWIHELTDTI